MEEHIQHSEVTGSTDRSFGVVFTLVFALIAVWPLFFSGEIRIWAAITSLVILAISILKPAILSPFNKIWFRFGLLLHKIINPIIMAVMFFGIFTPTALLLKIAGKDLLRLKINKKSKSYWVERNPPGPASDSMRNQF
jgi:predicted membrane metal-binding protein